MFFGFSISQVNSFGCDSNISYPRFFSQPAYSASLARSLSLLLYSQNVSLLYSACRSVFFPFYTCTSVYICAPENLQYFLFPHKTKNVLYMSVLLRVLFIGLLMENSEMWIRQRERERERERKIKKANNGKIPSYNEREYEAVIVFAFSSISFALGE